MLWKLSSSNPRVTVRALAEQVIAIQALAERVMAEQALGVRALAERVMAEQALGVRALASTGSANTSTMPD